MLDIVKKVIIDIVGFEEDEININSKLYSELDLDSLDMAQIMLAIENHYKITIESEEIADIRTVKELLEIIEYKL